MGLAGALGLVLLGTAMALTFGVPGTRVAAVPFAQWESSYPRLMVGMLGVLASALVAATAALWPPYGLWSPVLVTLFFVASLMLLTLVS
jgi:hypothetical protein